MRCRSSIAMPRNGNFRPDNLPQNLLAITGNLCFRLFVVGMLIFIIIASTCKNADPFFHPSSLKVINFLTPNSNAPFTSDVGSVRTGEEELIASARSINLADIDSEMQTGVGEASNVSDNNRDCGVDGPIDCRDPDVFHLLMRAAIDKFKDTHFYRFGKPVRGDNDSSCHMAWRFRPKQEKDTVLNKDYRSFVVVRFENCSMGVDSIGEYHSGSNARKRKAKGGKNKAEESSVTPTEIGEAVDDTLPVVESEHLFIHGKYLIYSGGGDRCKTMAQYLWSFLCMLGESQYLNRTLVMDISICLSKIYSSSGVDEEGKDFRFYFDFEHLKHSASVLDQHQFWSEWGKWQQRDGLSLHLVEDFRVTPLKLAEVSDTLIMRKFGYVEPDNYWYRVCEGETASVIQRPWHMIWKSRRLMDIASAIASRMNSDYDAVHVDRRGSDRDTQPGVLLSALNEKIKTGRQLYVATNEQDDRSFFDPLKEKYSTHFLDEYRDLWDAKSDWDAEMKKINNGITVEFDGYMRAAVDREVFLKGKIQIETFKDLTQSQNCKHDSNKCTSTS